MTAINFPDSPSNGDTHVVGGVTYTYDSTETKWKTTINSNAFLPLTGGTVSGNIVLDGELQHSGDTDTKLHFDTDTIKFDTAGSERARIDSSGRLLVGTSTSTAYGAAGLLQILGTTNAHASIARATDNTFPPTFNLAKSRGSIASPVIVNSGDVLGVVQFAGYDGTDYTALAASISCQVDGTPDANDMPGRLTFSTTADGASSPTERMRITSTGDLRFNSGYGSVATAYGVRAWSNFDGSSGSIGTGRASGNISSVTDNGTGDYTLNFSNAMPDANYAAIGNATSAVGGVVGIAVIPDYPTGTQTTTALRIQSTNTATSKFDAVNYSVAIFR